MGGFSTRSARDYHDKDEYLWEYINSTGCGIMGYEFNDVPDDCVQFCLGQYERFNIPLLKSISQIISFGASSTLYFADVYNPYCLFHGVSDVNVTDEWSAITYKIFDPHRIGGGSYEPDPNHVESFIFVPGQSEEVFNTVLANPGLDALPNGDGFEIREVMKGYGSEGNSVLEGIDSACRDELYNICTVDGVLNKDRVMAYFELAAWAAYAWLIGPPSRGFRIYHNDIIDTVVQDGECILVDGNIISPKFYNKIDRPPMSCYKCGTQVWCVEHIQIGNHSGYMCEACLNFDMPKSKFTNCGSRYCTFSSCPNHPYAHMGKSGAMAARRENGQLLGMARGQAVISIMGKGSKPLLL